MELLCQAKIRKIACCAFELVTHGRIGNPCLNMQERHDAMREERAVRRSLRCNWPVQDWCPEASPRAIRPVVALKMLCSVGWYQDLCNRLANGSAQGAKRLDHLDQGSLRLRRPRETVSFARSQWTTSRLLTICSLRRYHLLNRLLPKRSRLAILVGMTI